MVAKTRGRSVELLCGQQDSGETDRTEYGLLVRFVPIGALVAQFRFLFLLLFLLPTQ
jgi:hypothetical protein